MTLIISKDKKNAKKIDKSYFEQEGQLQQYIYDNPESIPLYEIKEDIKLLILSREVPTHAGPIDALGVDKNGEIYIIETKLYKNPDKRTVVAQVLDYGASLWKNSPDFSEFIEGIDAEMKEKLGVSLFEKLKSYFKLEDEDLPAFMEDVKSNMKRGNFRFVVLMDKLHTELKDLIVFINQNSQFDIYAVELDYYRYENYEILIPKLFGTEVKKDVGVSRAQSQRREWDENSFFEDARKKLTPEQLEAVKKIYQFSKEHTTMAWGTGVLNSSFNPKFGKMEGRSLFTVYSNGKLQINLGSLQHDEEEKKLGKRLISDLQKIDCFKHLKSHDKYPLILIQDWCQYADDFIKVIRGLGMSN